MLRVVVFVCLLAVAAVGIADEQHDGPIFIYPEVFDNPERDEFVFGTFPENFKIGLASASYQVEGAWNADGKGVNIWDTFCHEGGHVYQNQTGNDACKSYYKWDEDVEMLKDINSDFYRFSISWSRIIPNGTLDADGNGVNQAGVDFYNHAIDSLIAVGVEPMVTMFHWDLPQPLQDMGGQTSREFPTWFAQYATVLFEEFGDRVKHWMTFNEPQTVADCYETGVCAPGILNPGVGSYKVVHEQMLAHQAAWHIYDDKYRATQQGKVGIAIAAQHFQPANARTRNTHAANKGLQFNVGWCISPLIKGNYPDVMINTIGNVSKDQGFSQSRLPAFTPEEQKLLKGAVDFIGLNYYTARIARHMIQIRTNPPSYFTDMSVLEDSPQDWPQAASWWLRVCPYGIRNLLKWVAYEYGADSTEWMITENGYSSGIENIPCDKTYDPDRARYIVSHMNQLLRAINEDGFPLTRYTLWSLLDNFEWVDGYSKKFGVYCTNFDDPERARTPRDTVNLFKQIIADNGFPKTSATKLKKWL